MERDEKDMTGRTGGGESGGGPYKEKMVPTDGNYDGGQSDKDYRGGGDKVDGGDNPNAPTGA